MKISIVPFVLATGVGLPSAWAAGAPGGRPAAVPSSFVEVQGATNLSSAAPVERWWTTLKDPELSRLISRALRNNLDLKTAEARLLEARAARRSARADLFPTVDSTVSFSRIRGGYESGNVHVGNGGSGGANAGAIFVAPYETNLFQVGFDASWEIDFFGGRRHELQAATADFQAAEEDRRDVMVSLAAECARNYLELRGAQRRIAITQDNVKLQSDVLHLTEVRAHAGLGTELDVERQREQLASTEASLPSLESAERESIYELSTLTAQAPTALVEELETSEPLPLAPPEIPVGLPGDLLLRRPDLRRARAQMVAAAARVGQARADLFPKIVLTGAAGRQATGIQQFTLGAGNFFSLGPQLSLPVFNAGRIRANIETQKQRLNESSLAYQNAILNVLREVETSLTSYQHEQERREELVIAEDASKRATQMANELYVRGLADFLSVLDAQRQQLQAEDALAESDTTVLTDLVAIYKSLGGGWQ